MIILGLLVIIILGIMWFVVGAKIPRRYQEQVVHLDSSIQDEINMSPKWWTQQYHAQLEASHAPAVTVDDGEVSERSFDGHVEYTYVIRRTGYWDCTCSECTYVKRLYVEQGGNAGASGK